ncbi:hypothetical protein OQA88_2678 [Cercophora sp. LCS_1]
METRLPTEILDEILDYLYTHHIKKLRIYRITFKKTQTSIEGIQKHESVNYKALASVCRTSRRLNQLATWRLYHSLTNFETRDRWRQIARTLIARPDIAQLVKHLILHDTAPVCQVGEWAGGLDQSLPPEVNDHFKRLVVQYPEAGFTPTELSRRFMAENNLTAQLALMASLCPNLDMLDCNIYPDTNCVEYGFCPPGSMQSLHSLRIQFTDCFLSPFSLRPGFQLLRAAPNIRFLRIFSAKGCHIPKDLVLKELTEVDLRMCLMHEEQFVAFLKMCPNLRRLRYKHYKHDPDWRSAVEGMGFSPVTAALAVSLHAPNLEYFQLDLVGLQKDPFGEFDKVPYALQILEKLGIEAKFRF